MRVLVTGDAGFIGSHIVEQFQCRGEVRVLDNLASGFRRNLNGLQYEFVEGSILNRALLRQVMGGCGLCVSLGGDGECAGIHAKSGACIETNATSTLLVLEEAAGPG